MTDEERTKLRRASAGALLLAGRRTERRMSAAASVAIAGAADDLSRRGPKRTAALLVLITAAKQLVAGLASAISAGRKEARGLAAQRLGAELRLAGHSGATSSPAILTASHMARMQADELEATIAAESLGGQWRGLAARAVLQAQRTGEDAGRAVAATRGPLAPRVERTAVTEAARAYNDEHEERLRDLVASGDLSPEEFLREWSALVDACEKCWHHDGEQVALDESFAGGDVPGSVHPRCACVEMLVRAA